jgi:hypothetical protein
MTIPRICFTFWEGSQLSKLHYYTIYSLVKYNPDMRIIIYTSLKKTEKLRDWSSHEHKVKIINIVSFESILSISNNIKLIEIDFESEYNLSSNISVVYKADFTRIAKLYEHGGVWFDFDILFVKPIPKYFFESGIDIYYFSYLGTIPTGLFIISPENEIVKLILEAAKERINNPDSYQTIGPCIWDEFFKANLELLNNSVCLPNSVVYPYISEELKDLFLKRKDLLKDDTIGIHWYNGAVIAKEYVNRLDIKNLRHDECIMSKYLYKVIYN